MAKRGRPRKSNDQKLRDALARSAPNDRIIMLRQVFSFVRAPADQRQDGRGGEIDSEICDGIGQLCAVGCLDGHGYEPHALRDAGRSWGNHLAGLLNSLGGARVSNFERQSPSRNVPHETRADRNFDRMDETLGRGYERAVLVDLIVEPLISTSMFCDEITPWAKSLIDEKLLERGRHPCGVMKFPTMDDRARLEAAIRGLCWMTEATVRHPWERAA